MILPVFDRLCLVVRYDDVAWVALCLEYEVAGLGDTPKEAVDDWIRAYEGQLQLTAELPDYWHNSTREKYGAYYNKLSEQETEIRRDIISITSLEIRYDLASGPKISK